MNFASVVRVLVWFLIAAGLLRIGWTIVDVMGLPPVPDDLLSARKHHIGAIISDGLWAGGGLIVLGLAISLLHQRVMARRGL